MWIWLILRHMHLQKNKLLFAALGRVAVRAGVTESGFRLIANTGLNGHQDVPHLHMHVLGGEQLGPMRPLDSGDTVP